jgi:predicted dehydrogenase
MTLRAVVIGCGWAGEGHTCALRYCGVEVVAICGRQASVVQAVAVRLEIPLASTDWGQTLETLKPDIVALTTPAALRGEVVELAAALGCHIVCEKPLAANATEARWLYTLAEQAGIQHAYAATHRYDPAIAWLAELLRNNTIGQLREVDLQAHYPLGTALTAWSWFDSLASGGGALNAGMPHFLGMLERITGSEVVKASGEARVLRRRAPFVPNLHDYRQRGSATPTVAAAEKLEWHDCDADHAFSALLTCAPSTLNSSGPNIPEIPVCIRFNWMAPAPAPTNGWYLYGDHGTLIGDGFRSFQVCRYDHATGERSLLPVPPRLAAAVPQLGDAVQNHWAALAQEFVHAIRGETHQPYLTFRDGWRYQEIIDAVRAGRGWSALPADATIQKRGMLQHLEPQSLNDEDSRLE